MGGKGQSVQGRLSNKVLKVTSFHAHSSCSNCLEYKVVSIIKVLSVKLPGIS